jgi:hypothetical protein
VFTSIRGAGLGGYYDVTCDYLDMFIAKCCQSFHCRVVVPNDWVASTVTHDKVTDGSWAQTFQKASMLSWHVVSHFLLRGVIRMMFGLVNGTLSIVELAYLHETALCRRH